MTVASVVSRNTYIGAGSTEIYNYTFKIFENTDLLVTVKDTNDLETELILNTDFTVTDAGETAGGTIVLVDANQDWLDADGDLLTGYTITIRRVLDLTQDTDIRNQGAYFPEIHEDTFDRLTMISQQLQDETNRSVKLPETIAPADFDVNLPLDILDSADKVIVVNPTGDGFVMGVTLGTISGAAAAAAAAAASAAAALVSENNAETAETNAELAETNAETAQAAAEAAQAAAELAETHAETAETNAETAETNSAASATASAASATASATSATASATSATASATSATAAATSATTATTQASNASTSASNAATSATNASNSAAAAATSESNTAAAVSAHEADTTNIHGIANTANLILTSNKLSALAATTSAELAGVISDETGTGALVFGTSPTIAGPALQINFGTATNTNRFLLPSDTTANLATLTNTQKLLAFDTTLNKPVFNDGVSFVAIGSGTGGSAGRNYFDANPSLASAITGYTAYDDGSVALPVDGTGGSPSSSVSRSTTTPLRGTADLNWVHTAADNKGEGFAYTDITIDRADLAKVLYGSFDYEIVSGTYATGDGIISIIQDPSGTPVYLQPTGYQIANVVGQSRHIFSFQTDYTIATYRICFHMPNTTATAWTMAMTNFSLGPSSISYGAPITNPKAYTPTVVGLGTITDNGTFWHREGKHLVVTFDITSGTHTAVGVSVSLPPGLSPDSSFISSGSVEIGVLGSSKTPFDGGLFLSAGATVYFTANSAAYNSGVVGTTWANTTRFSGTFKLPILGWDSSVVMSDSSDTRVCAASYTASTQTLEASGAGEVIVFPNIMFDTHGAMNTSTGVYTVKVPGFYKITGSIMTNSVAWTAGNKYLIGLRKNSSLTYYREKEVEANNTMGIAAEITRTFQVNAGDILEVFFDHDCSAGNITLNGDSSSNYVSVERLTGPSAIAASEKITASYNTNAGQSIAASTVTTLLLEDRVIDTHGSYNTATGEYTCSGPGDFLCSLGVTYANAAWSATSVIRASIFVTGVEKYRDDKYIETTQTAIHNRQVTGIVRCIAGDIITFKTFHDNASARSILSSENFRTYMSITRV